MTLKKSAKEGQRDFVERVISTRLDALGQDKYEAKKLPKVVLPDSIKTLLNTSELWFEVDGEYFLFRALLLLLIERVDADDIRLSEIDEFVSRRREKWGINPKTVKPKQRYQLWERDAVQAFATHMIADTESMDRRESKIVYRFVPDVKVDNFLKMNQALLDEFCGASISG